MLWHLRTTSSEVCLTHSEGSNLDYRCAPKRVLEVFRVRLILRARSGECVDRLAFRLLSRGEIDENVTATKLKGTDHKGRYNIPNSNMVVFMYEVGPFFDDGSTTCKDSVIRCVCFQTDNKGAANLPKGLSIYPRFEQGVSREVPFFTPEINALCYPFIHPFGTTDFKNSTIQLLKKPLSLSEEELKVSNQYSLPLFLDAFSLSKHPISGVRR